MGDKEASSSRACSSPSRPSGATAIGLRSPTKIRTPTKLVRPREAQWAVRKNDSKKRPLEFGTPSLQSGLPAPKRLQFAPSQTQESQETQGPSGGEKEAAGASQETGEEGYTGGYAVQEESLERRVQVAQALEEDLLRDNAMMRLKALSLREEVDFYYGVLARIELLAAQERRQGGDRNGDGQSLADKVQSIISASKPVEDAVGRDEKEDSTETK